MFLPETVSKLICITTLGIFAYIGIENVVRVKQANFQYAARVYLWETRAARTLGIVFPPSALREIYVCARLWYFSFQ
jgi:hypothetical protein